MGTALVFMGVITLGTFIVQLLCYNNYVDGK